MHQITRLLLVTSALSAAMFGGCATEEIPQYGDPANLVGSAGATAGSSGSSSGASSSSSGGMCDADAGCTVSFANDIFTPILEAKGKCSDSNCHAPGTGKDGPTITAGDAAASYASLVAYVTISDGLPYVVPCNPPASQMLCNMKLGAMTGLNAYGDCSNRMPKVSAADMVADEFLTQADVNKIAEWIKCGAPNN